MALINWNSNYSVKVMKFDKHHQQLINLINKLNESMNCGEGKESLGEVLEELLKYTDYHFKAEESLMLKYKYIYYAKHKTEHVSFINKVKEIQRSFLKDEKYVTIEAFIFLKEWLVNHILNSDKKYGDFFNNQGIK